MSLINNKFLSLTNRLQLQAQAKILQQEQQEEKSDRLIFYNRVVSLSDTVINPFYDRAFRGFDIS